MLNTVNLSATASVQSIEPSLLPRRATVALIAAMLGGRALAQVPLSLATSTPGGGLSTFGEALAAGLVKDDPGLVIAPRNTAGSAENVPLLTSGGVDLAIVAGDVATGALGGPAAPTILGALYGTPVMFVLRRDSPHRDIAALRGQPVLWGARSSNFVVLARQVMGSLGFDIERDFDPVFVTRMADAPAMVLDGRVAALWGGGAGWPPFLGVANGPGGARFLPPNEEEQRRIMAAQPSLRPMQLLPGSYPGQDTPVPSIGTWVYVLARPGLPEETAYRIARRRPTPRRPRLIRRRSTPARGATCAKRAPPNGAARGAHSGRAPESRTASDQRETSRWI
jgi:TRAP transporter TAXI family solute receptor